MALAARVAAAAAVGVAVSASAGTVGFATFFDRFSEGDNTQARRTGAFHLGDGGHFTLSWWVCLAIHIYEHIFRCKSRECKNFVTKGEPIALI